MEEKHKKCNIIKYQKLYRKRKISYLITINPTLKKVFRVFHWHSDINTASNFSTIKINLRNLRWALSSCSLHSLGLPLVLGTFHLSVPTILTLKQLQLSPSTAFISSHYTPQEQSKENYFSRVPRSNKQETVEGTTIQNKRGWIQKESWRRLKLRSNSEQKAGPELKEGQRWFRTDWFVNKGGLKTEQIGTVSQEKVTETTHSSKRTMKRVLLEKHMDSDVQMWSYQKQVGKPTFKSFLFLVSSLTS